MSELKPCPFCGGEVGAFFTGMDGMDYRFKGYDVDGDVNPYIHCDGRDSEWFSVTADDVIAAWNRRADT